MVKIVILIKKKAGMSRDDFIKHYETSHAVIGKRLLGHLWTKYVRNYPKSLMEYQPENNNVDDSYDAVTEIWLKDEAAMNEMARIELLPVSRTRSLGVMMEPEVGYGATEVYAGVQA